jgi:ankyrin repeat protein
MRRIKAHLISISGAILAALVAMVLLVALALSVDNPVQGPAARGYHALAYETGHHRVILFGGQTGDGLEHPDIFLAADTWTQKHPAGGPGRLSRLAMIYSLEVDPCILFGGQLDSRQFTYSDETWLYDCDADSWENATVRKGESLGQRRPGEVPAVRAGEVREAVKRNDLALVKSLLVKDPALVAAPDEGGRTPLHWAVDRRDPDREMIECLLASGANVNAQDKTGKTALHLAAQRGSTRATAWLVDKGAELNLKDQRGESPLLKTIFANFYHKEIIDILLAKGAEVPVDGESSRRLLHKAAAHGHLALVSRMIDKGVDLNSTNDDGGTLLHSAAGGNLSHVAGVVLNRGGKIDQRDRYGYSALHCAAAKGNNDAALLLIARGADIDARTPSGETPYNLAQDHGQTETADILRRAKVDTSAPRFPKLRGDFLGQKRPGPVPELFAPGIVSTALWEHGAPSFSPNGNEVYWTSTMDSSDLPTIRFMKRISGIWTPPSLASFTTKYGDYFPAFSTDGRELLFVSYRPFPPGTEPVNDGRLWVVERKHDQWSEPKPVFPKPETGTSFSQAFMTKRGTLYFSAIRKDSRGGFDVYRSRLRNGEYQEPENIGGPVNTPYDESIPYVSPDESYLIFSSADRPENIGWYDLYISFHKRDGSWTKPRNMGGLINANGLNWLPIVSPDGKLLFFSSSRNGNMGDVYWADAKVIDAMRPRNLR